MEKSTEVAKLDSCNVILNKVKARYLFLFFALFIGSFYLIPEQTENIMGGRTHLLVMASISGALLLFINLFVEL